MFLQRLLCQWMPRGERGSSPALLDAPYSSEIAKHGKSKTSRIIGQEEVEWSALRTSIRNIGSVILLEREETGSVVSPSRLFCSFDNDLSLVYIYRGKPFFHRSEIPPAGRVSIRFSMVPNISMTTGSVRRRSAVEDGNSLCLSLFFKQWICT